MHGSPWPVLRSLCASGGVVAPCVLAARGHPLLEPEQLAFGHIVHVDGLLDENGLQASGHECAAMGALLRASMSVLRWVCCYECAVCATMGVLL